MPLTRSKRARAVSGDDTLQDTVKRARSYSSSLSPVPPSPDEAIVKQEVAQQSPARRTKSHSRRASPSRHNQGSQPMPNATAHAERQREKKLSVLTSFSHISPFPTYPHPTPSEAEEVYQILAEAHPDKAGGRKPQPTVPAGNEKNSAQTCGDTPNVLDALIGTILSQNTSSKNSTGAKRSLDAAFRSSSAASGASSAALLDPDAKIPIDSGTTPDEHKFFLIATAPAERVVDAIRSGGLAQRKAANIQNLLREVKSRWGKYSLQFMVEGEGEQQGTERWTDEAIMRELVSYPGVGPKTAACVLLFCMGRDSFAVDTHVFRLSRLLGWVPRAKSISTPVKTEDDVSKSSSKMTKVQVDRVTTQMHLDVRVPKELKYPLHVLMVNHGRACKGCKSVSAETGRAIGKDTSDGCPLRRWVREMEKNGKLGDANVGKADGEGDADIATDGESEQ